MNYTAFLLELLDLYDTLLVMTTLLNKHQKRVQSTYIFSLRVYIEIVKSDKVKIKEIRVKIHVYSE